MLTENDIPLFRALFLNNITDADARVLLQKAGRLAHHRCISLLGAAGFLRREAPVAQVKGHLFPYSRYFTLSTESISDEQSRDGKAIFFQP